MDCSLTTCVPFDFPIYPVPFPSFSFTTCYVLYLRFIEKENWIVYKVWWGHKELMAKDISNVAGVNTHHQLHSVRIPIFRLLFPPS